MGTVISFLQARLRLEYEAIRDRYIYGFGHQPEQYLTHIFLLDGETLSFSTKRIIKASNYRELAMRQVITSVEGHYGVEARKIEKKCKKSEKS